jgi:molybdopterin converting factor small subunit
MTVHVPSPLHGYTGGRSKVEASGRTLGELLEALDREHPGFRFRVVDERDRIRSTILVCVDSAVVRDLAHPLEGAREVRLIAALSGG